MIRMSVRPVAVSRDLPNNCFMVSNCFFRFRVKLRYPPIRFVTTVKHVARDGKISST